MKVAYKKRHLNKMLIFGLVWLIWFIFFYFTKDKVRWFDLGAIGISLMYFSIYFYEKKKQYLTIENDIIKQNHLFGKEIALSEVKKVNQLAGNYTLKTTEKEFTINTSIIDPESLTKLRETLKKFLKNKL